MRLEGWPDLAGPHRWLRVDAFTFGVEDLAHGQGDGPVARLRRVGGQIGGAHADPWQHWAIRLRGGAGPGGR
ncbi:MAG TPA: hypothetical protein VFC19_05340, partial [Candidatus Limnocylindrales bacterium]|nr:hypothetical protein [Candidatus Limnocylindrales bacterium]